MATLEYFLVAESVSIDQTTNQVSVFNILEDIIHPALPALIPHCAAITLWNADPDDRDKDFQVMLRIVGPGGETHEVVSNFTMRTDRHRTTQRIQGLPILKPGVLRFEVLLNGARRATHLVTVKGAPALVGPETRAADPES